MAVTRRRQRGSTPPAAATDADRSRSGTRTRSSTSCTSRRSSTPTTTASATSAGLTEKLDYVKDLGRQHDLAAAVLPVAAARRRLRRRRLPQRASVLRHARRLPAVRARGAPARPARHHRAGHQPHLGPASVVPGGAARAEGLAEARLLRLERRPEQVRRHAHHLHRHREVELGLGRGRQGVLLASLLQPPAGPQLRQSAGAQGDLPRHALLARHGRRRLPARRDSLPVSSARAPTTRTCPRRTRC